MMDFEELRLFHRLLVKYMGTQPAKGTEYEAALTVLIDLTGQLLARLDEADSRTR